MNWRDKLLADHPRIFGTPAQAFPECDEGWYDLLERCCRRIENALGPGESFRVTQIKEKFATLRFYYDGNFSLETKQKIETAVDLAECRSACTCEICGAEGRLFLDGAYHMTRCAAHAKGEQVRPKPGCENLLITWESKDGELRVVACRQYVRETDSFAMVDPERLNLK